MILTSEMRYYFGPKTLIMEKVKLHKGKKDRSSIQIEQEIMETQLIIKE